jgi:hypothetical protein
MCVEKTRNTYTRVSALDSETRLRWSRSHIEDFDSDSILNLHHEKGRSVFLLHSNNLTLHMLVNEQKSATFSSIVEIRGKRHHKNAHNNKCHIYYSLNYDKKNFGVSRSPTETIGRVGIGVKKVDSTGH